MGKTTSSHDNDIQGIDAPQTARCFVKIPEDILVAQTSEKRIDAWIYLYFNQTRDSTVSYCLNHMIEYSGYSVLPNKHATDSTYAGNMFISAMQWFYENGYISDFKKEMFIGSKFQNSPVSLDSPHLSHHGQIYDFEITYIKTHKPKYTRITTSKILLVLAYIRLKMWRRHNQSNGHSSPPKKNKPEIFYSYINIIADKLHLDERMVSHTLSWLSENGFIAYEQLPTDVSNGYYTTGYTVFVDRYRYYISRGTKNMALDLSYDYKGELAYGKQYLLGQRYRNKKFHQGQQKEHL